MASQSDYMKYKRISVQLKNLIEYPNVINSSSHTDFMGFQLENTISDTNIMYNKLLTPNYRNVFGMGRYPQNCSQYALCYNTSTRANRELTKHILCDPMRPLALKTAKIRNPMKFMPQNSNYCIEKCLDNISSSEIIE